MFDPFEKHVKNLLFTREAEKCDTLEAKIKFCRQFLKENVTSELGWTPSIIDNDLRCNLNLHNNHKTSVQAEIMVPLYDNQTIPAGQKNHIESQLNTKMIMLCISSGFVTYSQRDDYQLRAVICRAQLGVWI